VPRRQLYERRNKKPEAGELSLNELDNVTGGSVVAGADSQLSDRQLDGVVGGTTALDQAFQGAVDAWNNMQNVIHTGVYLVGPADAGTVLNS